MSYSGVITGSPGQRKSSQRKDSFDNKSQDEYTIGMRNRDSVDEKQSLMESEVNKEDEAEK